MPESSPTAPWRPTAGTGRPSTERLLRAPGHAWLILPQPDHQDGGSGVRAPASLQPPSWISVKPSAARACRGSARPLPRLVPFVQPLAIRACRWSARPSPRVAPPSRRRLPRSAGPSAADLPNHGSRPSLWQSTPGASSATRSPIAGAAALPVLTPPARPLMAAPRRPDPWRPAGPTPQMFAAAPSERRRAARGKHRQDVAPMSPDATPAPRVPATPDATLRTPDCRAWHSARHRSRPGARLPSPAWRTRPAPSPCRPIRIRL